MGTAQDHKGCSRCRGGADFRDGVAELTPRAQAELARVLLESEIWFFAVPGSRTRIAAVWPKKRFNMAARWRSGGELSSQAARGRMMLGNLAAAAFATGADRARFGQSKCYSWALVRPRLDS